jgi:hypothetical protein
MNANELGTELNFAIIDEVSQLAVGTTSFYRVVPEHKRLELGTSILNWSLQTSMNAVSTAYNHALYLSHAPESMQDWAYFLERTQRGARYCHFAEEWRNSMRTCSSFVHAASFKPNYRASRYRR